MTARLVAATLDAAFLLAMAGWVGGLAFVTFESFGEIRRKLGGGTTPEVEARSAALMLERLYAWGTTLGAIALPASLGAPLAFPVEYRNPWVGVEAIALIACTLAMLYGGNSLVPAIERARRGGVEERATIEKLLTRAIRLHVGVLALGVILLVAFAFRPPPATPGIVEPTPQERARRAFEAAERASDAVRPDGPSPGGR